MNVRALVDDDAAAVAALISAEEERVYGRPGRLTGADILMFLQYAKETWVWEEDGRLVASASYGVHGDAVEFRGVVADKGRGLGTEIVERGEAFGTTCVTLDVDSQNESGAVALYDRAGMHVEQCGVAFEKTLE
jgi:ribosomal protein S18 acetylase RimI-like enzyme